MDYACEITGLVKRFGPKTAVDGLSLRVPVGMLYGFLGVNGAGKTTTLRMISGLIRPDAGEIRVCGVDAVAEPQRAKQPLAYIPDDPVLYAKLNPMEHLEFVAALWNVEPVLARQRAHPRAQADPARRTVDRTRRLRGAARQGHPPRISP